MKGNGVLIVIVLLVLMSSGGSKRPDDGGDTRPDTSPAGIGRRYAQTHAQLVADDFELAARKIRSGEIANNGDLGTFLDERVPLSVDASAEPLHKLLSTVNVEIDRNAAAALLEAIAKGMR